MEMRKKIYALAPSEREKDCEVHYFTWTGLIPCTGRQVCHLCGYEKKEKSKMDIESIKAQYRMLKRLAQGQLKVFCEEFSTSTDQDEKNDICKRISFYENELEKIQRKLDELENTEGIAL